MLERFFTSKTRRGNFLVALPNDDADLSVSFQVAFDEWEKRLLVAVKVADDVHTLKAQMR